ncbi:MAG: lipopolysaccharide biosynthesis protein [Paludibacteraceae bacterium]|nr:lipopolysaccharide biosynthesis protein [Paludibacteraceae bacterium]
MSNTKREFTSAIFYTAIAKYSGIFVQIAITAILARLLKPEDFGIVAIASVLMVFFVTLTEAGLGPAIIQKKDLTEDNVNSFFTLTLIIGTLLSIVFFFSSYYIGYYYDNEELVEVCQWLCLLILFSSADIVPSNLLLKQKKFKLISIRTFIMQVISGTISIIGALNGMGLYALVLSAILSKILIFGWNYLCNPIKLGYGFSIVKSVASYSIYQFFFNLVNYLTRNIDKLLIGKYVGMTPLGFYEKSYKLMMLPLTNITYVITPVMHPIFSDFQNQIDVLIDKYMKLLKVSACLSFPLMVYLYFIATELVLIFFGDQWIDSVIPFKILSLTVGLQVVHASASGVYQSINYTSGLFLCALTSSILIIAGFAVSIGLFGDINSVSFSFMLTCNLSSFLVFIILFRKLEYPMINFFKVLIPGAVVSFIVAIVLYLISYIQIENIYYSFLIKSVVTLFISVLMYIKLRIISFENGILKPKLNLN